MSARAKALKKESEHATKLFGTFVRTSSISQCFKPVKHRVTGKNRLDYSLIDELASVLRANTESTVKDQFLAVFKSRITSSVQDSVPVAIWRSIDHWRKAKVVESLQRTILSLRRYDSIGDVLQHLIDEIKEVVKWDDLSPRKQADVNLFSTLLLTVIDV